MSSDDRTTVRVGTRRSQLALVQTNLAIAMLKRQCSGLRFEVVEIATVGDKILDVVLSKIGDKSLFTKELEVALLNKEVDFVVHSLKDVPTAMPPGLVLGCVFDRASPDDVVLMSPENRGKRLCDLPDGSIVGTSALRRVAALRRTYSKLKFTSIRGNLNTRLKKLDQPPTTPDAAEEHTGAQLMKSYDAIILAKAGIERLGWSDRIDQVLSDQFHAVSQGALACECRQDDDFILSTLSLLHNESAALSSIAERALMRRLDGGCSTPIGVRSHLSPQTGGHPWFLKLDGCVMSVDGSQLVQRSVSSELPHQVPPDKKRVYSCAFPSADEATDDSPRNPKTRPSDKSTLNINTTGVQPHPAQLIEQTIQTSNKPIESDTLETCPRSEELRMAENPNAVFMGVHVKPICSVARLRMARTESIGYALAGQLLASGADKILDEIRAQNRATAGSATQT